MSSVAQLCPTLCDPMNCSTPGFPVHHQLLELTQTHVHSVSDAIQQSHPLLPPLCPQVCSQQLCLYSCSAKRFISTIFVDSISSVQSLSHVRLCNSMHCSTQASLSITDSWSLLKLMSIESVMPYNHLVLCHPLPLLPSIFPSIRVVSNESVRIRWAKYWSFSFNISPSNEYSGLISFRMDWLDLLAFQGTLKSLLQHHSSKASILQHSAFFMVQLSHPYMTTENTMALTRQTFVGKVMSLLLNMLGHGFSSKE